MAAVMDHPTSSAAEHVVQFYGSDAELTALVGERLHRAIMDGAVAIVVATDAHHRGFESHLRARGVDVEAARGEGSLVTLDAVDTLARFSDGGAVDYPGLVREVGPALRAAAATGRPVLIFGEMVALLWEAGRVPAAVELEAAWDELAARTGCAILCAYPRTTVTSRGDAPSVDRMCALHSGVVGATIPDTTWQFRADVASAAQARHLLADLLRGEGLEGSLLDDGRIVVAELAANAVVHAGTPFSVRVLSRGPFVRIEVSDRSSSLPRMQEPDPVTSTGRGLRLVAALARRWGVEALPEGKTVWAELA